MTLKKLEYMQMMFKSMQEQHCGVDVNVCILILICKITKQHMTLILKRCSGTVLWHC